MKKYYLMQNVGTAKYLVCYHNGESTHNDGSPFYDVAIFRNKVKLNEFIGDLLSKGYTYKYNQL